MTWLKYPILFILFFLFSLLQASFFPYFAIFGAVPNLVFVLFFILMFSQPQHAYGEGLFATIMAGLFSDMFLPSFFGISMVCLLIIYFLNKLVNYFLRENQDKYFMISFIAMFLVSFTLYNVLLYVFSLIFQFEFTIGAVSFIGIIYSLPFACAGLYMYKVLFSKNIDNQLKLF